MAALVETEKDSGGGGGGGGGVGGAEPREAEGKRESVSRLEAASRLLRGDPVRSRRRPGRLGPGPGLGRRGRSRAGSPRPEPRRM